MKKVLSLILSAVMLASVLAGVDVTALALESGMLGNGVIYTLDDDGTLYLSKRNDGNGRTSAYSTTKHPGFYNSKDNITRVVVNDGVVELGEYLFYGCNRITEVVLANSVDTLGKCCFYNCTALTGIRLPEGCAWYYDSVFQGCTSLKWCVLPTNNSTSSYSGKIPNNTFRGCSALESVYVGTGVTGLGTYVFYGCTKLKYVYWDSGSISSTGNYAFGGTATNKVPSTCTFMDDTNSLSSWCSSKGYQFSNSTVSGTCSSNTYSSSRLTYSFNPTTRTLSFTGSGDMSSTPWSDYECFISTVDFTGTNGKYSVMENAFKNVGPIKSVRFGSNCYAIKQGSFENCDGIETLYFENNTSQELHIYPSAFNYCFNSTYWLDIPQNTRYIDDNAFNNTKFNYVKIFSNNITMGDDAFGCTGYARFFTNQNVDFYNWVRDNRDFNSCNWWCYCLSSATGGTHHYVYENIEPTCTRMGFDAYHCPYCDVNYAEYNFVPKADHKYSFIRQDGNSYVYSCSACGANDLRVDILGLTVGFADAISHIDENTPYNQSNYNGKYDVLRNGYINAKDYSVISKAVKGVTVSNNKATTINTSTRYQTINGFGASACWWSQDVGGWDNVQDVIDLLYSKEKGIGLDIYRYNLGGGSENDTAIGDWHRRAEDFLSSSSNINNASTYNWSADANAQLALAAAQRANSNLKVTLFSNTPPVSITTNGKGYCNSGASSNLSSSNYQAFANYVANCAEHFIDQGYNVTELSPINEPEWGWDGPSQEGSRWTAENARTFYNNYMIPTVKNRTKLNGKVGVSVWECAQMNHSDHWNTYLNNMFSSASSYSSNNANIRSYVDCLDVHSYWDSDSDRQSVANQIKGSNYSAIKNVRCSEYCQMTGDSNTGVRGEIEKSGGSTNGLGIEYGIALADLMYKDLTVLNAIEWDWWTAVAGGIYPDGLVYVNLSNENMRNNENRGDIVTSKRLWCMGNYSRFIDEGAVRVEVTTGSGFGSSLTSRKAHIWTDGWGSAGRDVNNYIKQSAYVNPDGTVVVVYINNSNVHEYTTFNSNAYSSFNTYVTDATHDLELYQTGSTSNVVSVPAMSVTTVVLTPNN